MESHKNTENPEKKYLRCGCCGFMWRRDFKEITKEEMENISESDYELSYDGCQENEKEYITISRDMALDAGDPSLEGQIIEW